jgi:hypothetical protein
LPGQAEADLSRRGREGVATAPPEPEGRGMQIDCRRGRGGGGWPRHGEVDDDKGAGEERGREGGRADGLVAGGSTGGARRRAGRSVAPLLVAGARPWGRADMGSGDVASLVANERVSGRTKREPAPRRLGGAPVGLVGGCTVM